MNILLQRGQKERVKNESITFDVPLALKFRSEMPNNTRLYLLAGLRYSRDFQSNEDLNIGVNKPIVALKKIRITMITEWVLNLG